ncbi:speckle-type POZ protein B [Caerostris darwini]|uniref:Speckle-type POZ protein B n=1 Tax=Caerostris darwini TaxID=1538125 RepID=A0AAV4W5J7_9ARAC|nr:speckle-type POZ protein B [Caerostris darwini]
MWSTFNPEHGKCTIIWKIENYTFANQKKAGEECNIQFSTEMIDYTAWSLSLFKYSKNRSRIACSITRCPGGPESVTIAFKLVVISPLGTDVELVNVANYTFIEKARYPPQYKDAPITNCVPVSALWKGTLILKCYLEKVVCPISVIKTYFARSRIEVVKRDYVWTLKNYNSGKLFQKILIPLKHRVHGMSKLNIVLYAFEENDEYLRIHILSDDSGGGTPFVRCKVSLLNSKGNVIISLEDKQIFNKCPRHIWNFPNFITGKMLNLDQNPSGVFHLSFKLAVSLNVDSQKEQNAFEFYENLDIPGNQNSLNNDLLHLYADKKLCDVTLTAGNKEFRAHKIILSSRSPVFESMFQNDMLEKNTGIVNVADMDSEILSMLLEFVYSDTFVGKDMDTAIKLYLAADKYQILSLREDCSSFMKSNLTVRNVCELLIFADDHRDDRLKTAVQDYICILGSEIMETEFWETFVVERPKLASEVLHKISLKYLRY